ncbi:AmmeMemoRadiSam system protein B [Nitrosomonas sp.]|uniref:AmmeMemoRadiSam system protein B n=1 Tax=Nitrosomonas sp. TaxID=42353 RepID=UPI001D51058E|nr:AmmeMemoRadiSam system protein B [Nitrosomonas sp.]MCB1948534.1 AmmeMemoRadiSam system protein B [Nitrosomonas sp.]MCP5241927.1 AmmeMemoRadiSam system protein B [Burkholderiales bacterium]MDR4513260.1 AmmeMemoRadiSam system protein B [Nitrosomonas sp.]
MTNIHSPSVRKPAVAGLFYPAGAQQLSDDVQRLMLETEQYTLTPKALIVPHAGYIYSGAIAATAYRTLHAVAKTVERVVLLGPSHRVRVHGLALPGAEYFDTPLGSVEVDIEAVRSISDLPQVITNPEAHELEHSLEVQLPFLQQVLGGFKVLPLAVGMASAKDVAEVLDRVWGDDKTLIVISSDLSHYLPYTVAQQVDSATVQSILQLKLPIAHDQACGATPVSGLIVAARKHHLKPYLLDLRNSGDTAGSRDQVVGYAAIAFCQN